MRIQPLRKNYQWELMYQNFWQSWGWKKITTEVVKAAGDCAVISLYYLLQVGEYTVKKQKKRNKANGAVQVGRYNVFSSGF